MAWLDDHPPAPLAVPRPAPQEALGVVVVHTAESVMDSVGPDTGAEGVANFIRTRDTPGSYHDLVDSDSTMHLVRWTCEAFHDGTGTNPHAYGLSFACRTSDWKRMSECPRGRLHRARRQRGGRLRPLGPGPVTASSIPARGSTGPATAGKPGFISHGERDPGRRSDPGADFPWIQFLRRFQQLDHRHRR